MPESSINRWVVPLFKGDAAAPTGPNEQDIRQRNEKIITGHDPSTGDRIERPQYVELVAQANKDNPALVQNIARIAAATLDGMDQNSLTGFVAVEGCEWDWGTRKRRGADIHQSMFNGVMPENMRSRIIQRHIVPYSDRTIAEERKVMKLARADGVQHVDFFTHEYHADRSRAILHNEVLTTAEREGYRANVFTPKGIKEGIQRRHPITSADEHFLYGIIDAAEPEAEVNAAEQKKERILWALMRTRQLTFGVLDPEWFILQAMKLKGGR